MTPLLDMAYSPYSGGWRGGRRGVYLTGPPPGTLRRRVCDARRAGGCVSGCPAVRGA